MDLSIIIPVYNGAECVGQIVEDIYIHNRNQFSYEILLIDDGSTDNTFAVCEDLIQKYKCVRYYRKENGGIASARNYGLEAARGAFITFADQDDTILNGYDTFLKRCADEQLDLIITAPYNRRADSDNINLRQFKDELIIDTKTIKKMAGKLIDGRYLSDDSAQFLSTSVWNAIYRRDLLERNHIRFKAFIDYEDDWIFNIEMLMASRKIAVTSTGYYCWNIHEGSESHRNKYIPDLLNKRKRWMEWLSTILRALSINNEKRDAFLENVLIPRNIMICFNNACWKPNATKSEILNEIDAACRGWDIGHVIFHNVDEMNTKNRMLLWLLIHKKADLAYRLNIILLKSRFH